MEGWDQDGTNSGRLVRIGGSCVILEALICQSDLTMDGRHPASNVVCPETG